MVVIGNIILLVSLFCFITALPAEKDHRNGTPLNKENGLSMTRIERNVVSEMYPEDLDGSDSIVSEHDSRSGVLNEDKRWPSATIPYEIIGFNRDERDRILKAMRTLEFWTCIKFIPSDTEHIDYIQIKDTPGSGCKSVRGRHGGIQRVFLEAPQCVRNSMVPLHELLHTVGLVDQHRRPDRDSYVTIHKENIKPSMINTFSKADESKVGNFSIPYDYNSVMHYPEYKASKNGNKTIEAKVTGVQIGVKEGMSVRDAMLVMKMYNCSYNEFNVSNTDPFSATLPNAPYGREDAFGFTKEKLYKIYFMNITSSE